jgi:hypothetical protein
MRTRAWRRGRVLESKSENLGSRPGDVTLETIQFCQRSSTFVKVCQKSSIFIVKFSSGMSETFFNTWVNWSCVTRCGCRTTLSTLFTVYLPGSYDMRYLDSGHWFFSKCWEKIHIHIWKISFGLTKFYKNLSKKTTFEVRKDHFGSYFWLFCKTNLFLRNSIPFRASEWALPRNSECPQNAHFFPRNNGIHSESIPRNFFGTKFRCQP